MIVIPLIVFQGEVLFCPEVETEPVITDIEWFLTSFKTIGALCRDKQFHNGSKVRSLGDEVPLFSQQVLKEKAFIDITCEKVTVYVTCSTVMILANVKEISHA